MASIFAEREVLIMLDDNCIFCKIAAGEIPSETVYEDEQFRAILDLGPASAGHTLILPKEALARKKAEGVTLGRPKGRKSSPEKYKLYGKETLIKELLKANVSKRKIAKLCKVDRNTLDRYIKFFLTEEK